MKLLFVIIIGVILIAPVGINLQKLAMSLSWNQVQVADDIMNDFAMATDPDGVVHLAYRGPDGLTYANNSGGEWVQYILGGTVRSCGIDVDSDGVVHIAAGLYTNGSLELVHLSNAIGHWESSVVDTEIWGYPVSIAADFEGNVHISYTKVGLKYATNRGTEWNTTYLTTYDSGWSSDIAVDSLNQVHIVSSSGHIGYFTQNGSEWTHETIWSFDLVLNSVSIALGALDIPHVSYFGGNSLAGEWGLRYAVRTDGVWNSTTVEKLESYSYPSCSIAIDSQGTVNIAYVNLGSHELKHVRIVGDNLESTVLDGSCGAGTTSCGIGVGDDGNVRICNVDSEHVLSYYTTESPHMFFEMLLYVIMVKAVLCAPFVAGYVLWWRRINRNQEGTIDSPPRQ